MTQFDFTLSIDGLEFTGMGYVDPQQTNVRISNCRVDSFSLTASAGEEFWSYHRGVYIDCYGYQLLLVLSHFDVTQKP